MTRAGAVWIDILPSLANFNALVSSQAQVSLDTVGATTGRGYGLSLTKGVKDGMSGMATTVAAQAKAAGEAAAAAVDAAEAKIGTARKRSADVAGTVTVAETRLADLRTRSVASAAKLTAAEAAVVELRGKEGVSTKEVEAAEARLQTLRERSGVSAGQMAAAEEAVAKAQRNAQVAADGLVRSEAALTTAQERQGLVAETAARRSTAGMAGMASGVEAGASRITGKLAAIGKGAAMMGGLFAGFEIAKFAGESIKAALDFEKSSQVLVNAAGESKTQLASVKQGMLDISASTGTDLAQVSEGMYTIEKAGIRGSAGLKVMSDSAKLARDENADLGVVTNALTTVMATSNGKLTDSAKAANALMVAAGNSKTSLQEFAGSLSAVLPVSSKVGISFDQVSGAIGAMTAQGMSAQQAGQNLNHVIAALAVPNRVAATEMQAFGLSAQDVRDNLGKRGLQGTIELLSDAVKSRLGPAAKEAAAVIQGMPAKYQDMWASLEHGTTTLSGFEKKIQSAKDLTAAQKDEITKAIPASQGYFQAMSKMTGGLTGLNVATMLTGTNAAKFTSSTKAVAEAMGNAKEFGEKWNATQATAQVRLDQAKDTIKAVGISLATNLLPYIADAAKGFADVTKSVVSFVQVNWDWLKPVSIGIGAIVAGMVLWTAAQAVFNAVAAANPVGLILIGIAALVVGIIAAYNHFETFHKIVDAVWAGIKTAAAATVDWITNTAWPALQTAWHAISDAGVAVWHAMVAAWNGIYGAVESVVTWVTKTAWPALQGALKAVGDAAVWLWHNIFEPVWTGIKIAVAIEITLVVLYIKMLVAIWQDVLAPVLLWLWHNVFEPTWAGIKTVVKAVGDWFSGTFLPALQSVFKAIGDAAVWLWHNVFEPTWHGIQSVVRVVVDWLTGTAWPVIQGVWRAIADGALWLWHSIIEPAFNGWRNIIGGVVDWLRGTVVPIFNTVRDNIASAFLWLWHNVAEPAWAGIRSSAQVVADWFSSSVVGTFNDVKDRVGAAFTSLKDTISTAWNAIRDTAKAPIEFVVNTVFAGLVNTYNSVAGSVGAPPMTVPHVAFASGGIMPGYTPGQDVYEFVDRKSGMRLGLSGGEPILRPEAGAVLGHGWVDGINSAARSGGQSGVRGFLGYAGGGVFPGGDHAAAGGAFDWLKGAASSAASAVSGAASNIAGFVTDPMGSFKALGEQMISGIPGGAAMKDMVSGVARKAWEGIAGTVSGLSQNAGAGGAPDSPAAQSAVSWALSQVGTSGWLDRCLAFVNGAWAHKIPWLGLPRAIDSWNAAPGKHPGDTSPPGGAALFYDHLGPAGHVDLAVGDGSIVSTDLPTSNVLGHVGFNTPISQWGAHYLGWALPGGGGGGPGASSVPLGSGVNRWSSMVLQALGLTGQPSSLLGTVLRRMNQESGGNERAINLTDSNAQHGTPSKGLMQVIDPTFAAYRSPLLSRDIYDPLANEVASMNYAVANYGSLAAAYNRPGGYADGGTFKPVKPILLDSGGVVPQGLFLGENRTGAPERLGRMDTMFEGGMRLTGTLDLGNGLSGFVDGRIHNANTADAVTMQAGG